MQRVANRAVLAALAIASGVAIGADAYPNRPIRLVVATAPSGAQDATARAIARQIEQQIGYPLVIDNRAGANGIVGYDLVAKAVPDGYTLLHTSVAFAINPSVYKKLPFDVNHDFTPITNVTRGEGALVVVHPSVPANNIRELIALAKEKPVAYSSPGIGNVLHLLNAAFNTKAGITMLHVPYKGAGPALNAVIGSEVQVMFVPPLISLQHIKAGRLRAIGYTGAKRLDALPDLPTVSEGGLPGYQLDTGWHAWFAPPKTPALVIDAIYAELQKALALPKLRDYFLAVGYVPVGDPPATFQKNFREDVKRWAEVAKLAQIVQE